MTMNQQEAVRLTQVSFPNAKQTPKVKVTTKCRLWAGMGHVYELSFGQNSFIVKSVDPTQITDSIGDLRKAASYKVEANFYKSFAETLLDEHNLPLPRPFYVECDGNATIICMSKLEQHSPRRHSGNAQERVVKWLARLHAATWGSSAEGLQPSGSYWYLDTRPDEHANMSRVGWEGRLKRAARAIDSRLHRDSMQCIIHGDAKEANILWTDQGELAMCDFQYCGKGPATRDLAYFLCSSTNPEDEGELLQDYYEELIRLLPDAKTKPSFETLKESLELAFCDYARFMAGWGYWGNDISRRVISILNQLDGGKDLGSEEAYDEAVRREFG
jgi:hypothetical protein